jgi:hypothetical protein
VSLDPQSQVREQIQEKKRIKQEKKEIKVDEISHPRMNFESSFENDALPKFQPIG